MTCSRSTLVNLIVALLIGLLAGGLSPTATYAQIEDRAELVAALDSAATAHAADSTVAGVAVAVVQRGDTLLHKGYGQADLEFDVPMPKDAIFEVGSITKQFTAAAILQLAAKDSIDLDAPITEYLPNFDTRGHQITLRHLLHHTSGLRSYTNMAQFQDIAHQELPRDTLLTLVETEPLRFAPGTAMSYSNSGYFLLGRMIEETSGQSYKSYLEEHLLGPAGMGDSYYCDEEAVVDHKAHGYWWSGKQGLRRKEYWDHTWLYSAGSLCSSVPDLVAWNRALHGGAVLPDSMYQQMTAPGRLADGTALRYGMGLAVPEDEGHPVIGHLGVVSGFLNASLYYPEGDLIIVALQNSRGPRAAWDLADELARLALGPRGSPERRPYEGSLSALAGRYAGPARGDLMTVQIRATDGRLLASEVGSDASPDTFRHVSGLTWRGEHNRFQLGRRHYRFVRAGDQIIELRLDRVYGHYVLRRIGAP